ncbi:hypothetical protein P368_20255 [Comamonas thiooxydans]|nr:hypothetical protein P369_22950 [Comamonas thiooxydans]KGG96341.1 hypothetical protein P367_19600 [Comamonas thiooxydans]KGH02774.1 hypothetical protein P365_17965 [Comamonas thiooxydans]KGH07759.1 hypothetical protein P368_20255 [Comamonas thiooxydans]
MPNIWIIQIMMHCADRVFSQLRFQMWAMIVINVSLFQRLYTFNVINPFGTILSKISKNSRKDTTIDIFAHYMIDRIFFDLH